MRRRSLAPACALAVLAACTREPPPEAPDLTPFDRGLAAGYERLRADERAENDWRDARGFRRKRDAALRGERPPPDGLETRALGAAARTALEDARARLLDVLDGIVRLTAPETLAEAQTAFDCWAQEAEEDRQPDEIAACRMRFFERLALAENASDASVVVLLPSDEGGAIVVSDGGADVAIDAPFAGVAAAEEGVSAAIVFDENAVAETLAASLAAEPLPQRSYLIYFETGGSTFEEITAASRDAFADALADVRATEAARVTVFGHSDRVGPAALNVRLSRERAAALRDALVAAGVPEAAIAVESFGESFPLVPTDDEVAEPRNRRVEIAVR
ncbi:MAG: OmpA family protein [Paracoccaceae bacterium]